MTKKKFVLSVGGSLIVPNGGIDVDFLSNLNQFIRRQLIKHPTWQFFIVAGGGSTARQYRDAGKNVVGKALPLEDMDWLGIHATRLNAHLLRTIFRDISHPRIIKHYDIILKANEPVVIASGWKPGWSTDYDAVLLCEDYDVDMVINMSNIKMVYDKDPGRFKNAKPLAKMNWKEYRLLVGDEWVPGMHAPFDPIAAKKAEELKLKVAIVQGDNFKNLEKFFTGKEFVGTIIR